MKEKLYERALLTCIIMLIVCVVFKLFGANWFDLYTDIPILQKGNELYYSNVIFAFCITFILKSFNGFLIVITMTKNINITFKKIYILFVVVLLTMALNYYHVNSILLLCIEFVSLIICGMLINKTRMSECILVMIFNLIYQIISFYIKSMGISLEFYGFIENNLFLIDYYIMLIITYLYLKKGETSLCSEIFRFYSFLRKKLWKRPTESSSPYSADKAVRK